MGMGAIAAAVLVGREQAFASSGARQGEWLEDAPVRLVRAPLEDAFLFGNSAIVVTLSGALGGTAFLLTAALGTNGPYASVIYSGNFGQFPISATIGYGDANDDTFVCRGNVLGQEIKLVCPPQGAPLANNRPYLLSGSIGPEPLIVQLPAARRQSIPGLPPGALQSGPEALPLLEGTLGSASFYYSFLTPPSQLGCKGDQCSSFLVGGKFSQGDRTATMVIGSVNYQEYSGTYSGPPVAFVALMAWLAAWALQGGS